MNQHSEPLIEGAYTVIADELVLEVIGTQSGPAGSVGGSLGADVEIELDGADPAQLNVVRVWRDGALSSEQQHVLETLFGAQASPIIAVGNSPRPTRLGTRSTRMSSREEGVQASLVTCVQALDSLQRVETPTAVRVLLRLAAVVHGSNFDPGCSMPTPDELAFAAIGLSEHGRLLLLEVLTKAQTLGLLSAEDVQRISTDSTATTTPTALQELVRTSSLDVSGAFSSTLSDVSRNLISKSTALHESLHQRPAIQVDPASLLSARTTASWGPESNLLVTVHGLSDTSQQLWARARYDADGSIVAVAPLTANGASLTATLLIPERDHVVLDVVCHAADRVITENVGALGRAFDLGRRAGRLERLGRITEASTLWEECAAAHAQAGDFQRQKMALSRLSLQRSIQAATFIDHVL